MQPYMDLIDELRELGIAVDLDIPQIAVIGDQSSGKSSVLHRFPSSWVPQPRNSTAERPATP